LAKLHSALTYERRIFRDIFSETYCFHSSWKKRNSSMTPEEASYLQLRSRQCRELFDRREWNALLLKLIELSDNAETLFLTEALKEAMQAWKLRDNLRTILERMIEGHETMTSAKIDNSLNQVSQSARSTMGIVTPVQEMKSLRNFGRLENYFERAKWQC
jgi:hypothetical protein